MKTNKTFLILLTAVFLISFVNAGGLTTVCIDKDAPSAPSNLSVTIAGDDITLAWNAATDIPECSGIDHYVVSRDGKNIGTSKSLTYKDFNVNPGNYSYSVFAVDKINHLSGLAIKNDVIIEKSTSDGGSNIVNDGGGGSSYICFEAWDCTGWSECVDGFRTRTCTDLNQCGTSGEKPRTSEQCAEDEEGTSLESQPSEQGFFSRITGAVVGGISSFSKSNPVAFSFVILVLVAAGLVIVRNYRLKKPKSQDL